MPRRLARWPLLVVAVAILAIVGALIAACERPPEPSVEAYCHEIVTAEGLDESLASFDPSRVATDVAALRRAARVAPPEIELQVDALVELTTALQATIETARTDQAEALEATLRDKSDQLARVTDAGRAVEDYTRANCGVELNSTAVPTSPPG